MTDVLDTTRVRGSQPPPARQRSTSREPARPRAVAGSRLFWLALRAALTDAALMLVAVEVVVLLAWAADGKSRSAALDVLRLGACFWLAALHTRVHIGAAVVGLPPLGLTMIILVLAARSAAHIGRDQQTPATAGWSALTGLLPITGAVALCNGCVAAAVALAVDTPTLHPSPATAVVGGAAVGALGATWGQLRLRRRAGNGTLRELLPEPAQVAVSAASTALTALLVLGFVLTAVLLLAHHSLVGALNHALSPGPVGTGALGILQLAVAPLLVVGAVSWFAGPGFAVGTGTSVTPWVTHLGPVPAVPILAALPSGAHHLGAAVLLVPVAVGVLAGVIVLRRHGAAVWWQPYAIAAGAAALVGLLGCIGAYAAGGPVGPGRLLTVGPSGWQVGLALAGEILLGATVSIAGEKVWATRRGSQAVIGGMGSVARERLGRLRKPGPPTP